MARGKIQGGSLDLRGVPGGSAASGEDSLPLGSLRSGGSRRAVCVEGKPDGIERSVRYGGL